MSQNRLSQEDAKNLVHYDPETGVFTKWEDGSVWGNVDIVGYRSGSVGGFKCMAHRLAFLYMEGVWPPSGVDHINHTKDDNSWANLRHATQAVNQKNKVRYKKNKSGITGVLWEKERGKWLVQIGVNGKTKKMARTIDFFEACCIRKSAELFYKYSDTNGC